MAEGRPRSQLTGRREQTAQCLWEELAAAQVSSLRNPGLSWPPGPPPLRQDVLEVHQRGVGGQAALPHQRDDPGVQ